MITAIILTFNEAPNIRRALESLSWVSEIVIIDSYSNDKTVEIALTFPKVIVHKRAFDNHTNQWNFGISKAQNDWVFSLDADYIISTPLKEEVLELLIAPNFEAYSIPFKYLVVGKPLTGTILPPRVALFNKKHSTYIQDGHTQLLKTNGKVGLCKKYILHDDRKQLQRWIWAQNRYVDLELDKIFSNDIKLSTVDKIRKRKYFAPFLILVYCLFVKGAIFNGKRGVFYAFQRMYFELLLSLNIIEKEFENNKAE